MASPYCTVEVALTPVGEGTGQAIAVVLDAVSGLIAEREDVGGVELRDATTLGGGATPTLCVYASPTDVEGLGEAIRRYAEDQGFAPTLTVAHHSSDAWRDAWKEFYRPQIFGGRLLLRPSWIKRSPSDPELEIVLDPGRAFGTGLHETTRLCLEAICTSDRAARVVDLGCGSGILALAAHRLWGAEVHAVDIDPEAVAAARENFEHNGAPAVVKAVEGGVGALEGERYELVVTNIRPEVLCPAAATVAEYVAPGGRLMLSGVLVEEAERVQAAYRHVGVELELSAQQGEWVLLQAGPR